LADFWSCFNQGLKVLLNYTTRAGVKYAAVLAPNLTSFVFSLPEICSTTVNARLIICFDHSFCWCYL